MACLLFFFLSWKVNIIASYCFAFRLHSLQVMLWIQPELVRAWGRDGYIDFRLRVISSTGVAEKFSGYCGAGG